MYAMDQTMHFEHRAGERSPRWELRRPTSRTSAMSAATPVTATGTTMFDPDTDTDIDPVHDFLD